VASRSSSPRSARPRRRRDRFVPSNEHLVAQSHKGVALRVRLLVASRNADKLRELRRVLPEWEVDLLGASDEPVEDGETFRDNARIKARHGQRYAAAGDWVVGEDSGIEVAALDGRPGVHSARWAADGVARLLAELEGVGERRARYVCELVAVSPDGSEVLAGGTLEGEIVPEARGSEGFGYDPIFVPVGESRTVAELGNAWKAEHSHRAEAARALAAALRAT
ncbi:MAG TPA: non-canonical purine NTP pyrophosphatase, partial [Gaiellaceae bacterium]|nr:non-canonical purine NTP pyrophosphatase [Gaiellaceae bacterium]